MCTCSVSLQYYTSYYQLSAFQNLTGCSSQPRRTINSQLLVVRRRAVLRSPVAWGARLLHSGKATTGNKWCDWTVTGSLRKFLLSDWLLSSVNKYYYTQKPWRRSNKAGRTRFDGPDLLHAHPTYLGRSYRQQIVTFPLWLAHRIALAVLIRFGQDTRRDNYVRDETCTIRNSALSLSEDKYRIMPKLLSGAWWSYLPLFCVYVSSLRSTQRQPKADGKEKASRWRLSTTGPCILSL